MLLPKNYLTMNGVIISQLLNEILQCSKQKTSIMIGLSGPQGSGKSTLSIALKRLIKSQGVSCQTIGLDDFYLTRAERQKKGQIHPLLQTRGVPGTHDHDWLLQSLTGLKNNQQVRVPTFDKLIDDRVGERKISPASIVIFEGWCVGCKPFVKPLSLNAFDKKHDQQGHWRTHVNEKIKAYQAIFNLIDYQIYLSIPSFNCIFQWRKKQQKRDIMHMSAEAQKSATIMNDHQLKYFIAHYERITKQMMHDSPLSADAVIGLDKQHRMASIQFRNPLH